MTKLPKIERGIPVAPITQKHSGRYGEGWIRGFCDRLRAGDSFWLGSNGKKGKYSSSVMSNFRRNGVYLISRKERNGYRFWVKENVNNFGNKR